MKLKLKFGSVSKLHEIDENAVVTYTLSDLKAAGRHLFPDIQCPFSFSLNKTTPLEGDGVSLKDHGIVSGDLLYVLTPNHDPPNACTAGSERPKPLPLGCVSVSEMFSTTCGKKLSDNSESELKENADSEVTHLDGVRRCETQARDCPSSENTAGCSKASLECSAESSGCCTENAGCSFDRSNTGNDYNMVSVEVDRVLVNRYLNEPLLCRESTPGRVPSILDDIHNSVNITTPHEAMCVVLHVLMLESGYESSDQEIQGDRNVSDSETKLSTCTAMETREDVASEDKVGMPHSWNCQAGRYFMKYVHTSCDRRTSFLLTCVPMGSVLVIHGTIMGYKSDKLHMNLNTSEYITDIKNGAASCYKNLSKLSRIYKDGLAHRLLQEYKFAKGEETNFGIFLLSHEVMLRIMGCLDTVSVLRVSQTCKVFNTLCKDNYIWRRLYLKDFGNRTDNSLNHYWQKLYKQEYRLRKERQRIWKRNPMPVFTPPMIPSFGLPPPGPFHPGILGGDHNLNPLINHSEDRFFPHQLLGQRSQHGNTSFMRPRFDPLGPLPGHNVIPGRRGGPRDRRGPFGGFGGPKLF